MEVDDLPTLRYIYRNFKPSRHLEFGTWEGTGVLCCLEECNATVWTINLLEGEKIHDNSWAYSTAFSPSKGIPIWANRRLFKGANKNKIVCFQTDALGFIGRYYREKGFGNRVCQVYCDSKKWDISNYPQGFFDTALIDGGHTEDIVLNDTNKALKLVRCGGIIMWHDFCPKEDVLNKYTSAKNVTNAIMENWDRIKSAMKDLFWIEPSWILIGAKK